MEMDSPSPVARDTMQRVYESLASAVLNAARARGYGGDDVQSAATLLSTPDPNVRRLCELSLKLWQQRSPTNHGDLQQAVDSIPANRCPSLPLSVELLSHLLEQAAENRGSTVVEAIESSDENHLGQLLGAALTEMGEDIEDEAPHRLLGQLIKRYRSILQQRSTQSELHRKQLAAILMALQDVLSGHMPSLDKLGEDGVIIAGIHSMLERSKETIERARVAEKHYRESQQELLQRDQEISTLKQEIRELQAPGSEDQRLSAYRDAFALMEKGEDPTPLLEQIRDQERVFICHQGQQDEALKLLDRSLEHAANGLGTLRRLAPFGHDPKRYRPRLLGKSAYNFKTLPGMLAACRDLSSDLGAFSHRIAWAEGLGNFGETLKELRPAMKEMVRFVADCREKTGDRVTMSLTVNMQTMAGLASLPALLAGDLLRLAKSRKAKDMIDDILPLSDEIITSYHAALAEGNDDCPALPVASKRASSATKLKQLATHLESLASFQEAQYQGAETQGFELTDNDRALMKDKDLLRRAAREIATMVEACGQLPGAPERAALPSLPNQHNEHGQVWHDFLSAHQQWLSEAARYRVQLTAFKE